MRRGDRDRAAPPRWPWGRQAGISVLLIQAGFALAAAWVVLAAVLMARWRAEQADLRSAVVTALRTALAESYRTEGAAGQGLSVDAAQFQADYDAALAAALQGSVTGCQPAVPQAAALGVCDGGVGIALPASARGLADPLVVDAGAPSLCLQSQCAIQTAQGPQAIPGPAVSATAVMATAPFLGQRIPLVVAVAQQLARGQAGQVAPGVAP